MNKEQLNYNIFEEEDSFDLKQELGYYLFFYPWFLISLIFFIFSTFVLLRYEDRIYEAKAQLQILKPDSDPSSFLTGGGSDGFGWFDRVNLENDIAIMSSNIILEQVVNRLNLQTNTYTFGSIVGSINTKLLFKNLPIDVTFKYPENSKILTFEVTKNTLNINDGEFSYSIKKGQVFDNETLSIKPDDSLFLEDKEFQIVHHSLNTAVNVLRANLVVEADSKRGEIVNLSYSGSNIDRNEAILNTLIDVLSEDQVADKREISRVSISFIEDRLKSLTKSIDTISKNTIDFQKNNNIFDTKTQTNSALNTIISGQEEIFRLGIQIEVTKELRKQLLAQNNYELIPANIGIDNRSLDQLVNSYNEIVMKRNSLLVSTTDQSSIAKQYNNQLQKSKSSIITGINRYLEGLEVSLNNYKQMQSDTRKNVATLPGKENMLRTLTRNFKIEEELYVFLLKRKEEAAISFIAALPNLKILSNGVSDNSPIYPKQNIFYLGAIFFGIFIPFGILFLLKLFDTKINTREDLEIGLKGIPIFGEVPFDESLNQNSNNSRGVTAESTRVIRSSISFILKKAKCSVITVTSTTKGEGKSFISYQLALSYKALGNKVILIGGDLRNPQLHNYFEIKRNPLGLSTFLANEDNTNLDSLIIKNSSSDQVDVLLSGTIPPNPSELLMSPRMQELLDHLKEKYDYIIIDSAPLMLVSDTSALLPISDLIVYVCRAQYSDKNIFPFINELQKRPNIPPFGLVLNGLVQGPSRGYSYRYGYRYRYSYSYKYNYGYGYGYGDKTDS